VIESVTAVRVMQTFPFHRTPVVSDAR
jgi:hypothetical protein